MTTTQLWIAANQTRILAKLSTGYTVDRYPKGQPLAKITNRPAH